MSLVYASPHFSWAELRCHDGTDVPDSLKPVTRRACELILEPIRQRFGKALVVVSGYRSKIYNRRIHGAPRSRHVMGDGFDIRPVSPADLPALKALVGEMIAEDSLPHLGGYGTYPGWIHVDSRPRKDGAIVHPGSLYLWTGNGQGSER